VTWTDLGQILGGHSPIIGTHQVQENSENLLHFEKMAAQTRMLTKVEAKFRTFWLQKKLGKGRRRCRSNFE